MIKYILLKLLRILIRHYFLLCKKDNLENFFNKNRFLFFYFIKNINKNYDKIKK